MSAIIGFVRSKSGRMLIVFLVLTAGISAAVANYVYSSALKTFFEDFFIGFNKIILFF